jgi:ribosomal protein L22
MATVETPRTSVRAVAKYVRTAPRKAQLVADQIRGRSVPEARTILAFMTRDAARDVEKVLRSAVANAEANHGLDGDELVVAGADIGAGPTLKRWRARARGRVGRIRRRTCHISITLTLPGGEAIPAAPPAAAVAEKPERAPRVEAEAPAAEVAEAVEPAEAEPPVTEAVIVEEPKPKPKRAPRKKAEEAPEAAVEAPEEKPKRAPRRKTEASQPAPEAEAPKRRSRTKSEEPAGEEPKGEPAKPARRRKIEEGES